MPPKAAPASKMPDILPEPYALTRDDHGTTALLHGVDTVVTCHYYHPGMYAVTQPSIEPRLFDDAAEARAYFWQCYVDHRGDEASDD